MEGFFITRISRMMGMNNRELNIRTTMITNLRGLIRANPCNPWQELSYEILVYKMDIRSRTQLKD